MGLAKASLADTVYQWQNERKPFKECLGWNSYSGKTVEEALGYDNSGHELPSGDDVCTGKGHRNPQTRIFLSKDDGTGCELMRQPR